MRVTTKQFPHGNNFRMRLIALPFATIGGMPGRLCEIMAYWNGDPSLDLWSFAFIQPTEGQIGKWKVNLLGKDGITVERDVLVEVVKD